MKVVDVSNKDNVCFIGTQDECELFIKKCDELTFMIIQNSNNLYGAIPRKPNRILLETAFGFCYLNNLKIVE